MSERKQQSDVGRRSALRTAEFFAARGAEADIELAWRILRRSSGQMPNPYDR